MKHLIYQYQYEIIKKYEMSVCSKVSFVFVFFIFLSEDPSLSV